MFPLLCFTAPQHDGKGRDHRGKEGSRKEIIARLFQQNNEIQKIHPHSIILFRDVETYPAKFCNFLPQFRRITSLALFKLPDNILWNLGLEKLPGR